MIKLPPILSDEELVAIFMGAEQHIYNLGFGERRMYHFKSTYPFDRRIIKDKEHVICDPKGLYYRTDWEWLMEVVEKIESMGYSTSIQYRESNDGFFHQLVISKDNNVVAETLMDLETVNIAETISKKDAIFIGVVNFVKYFNIQNSDNRIIVFDARSWSKTGDVGDNSKFYLPATIIHEFDYNGEAIVNVRFDDGRISNGHLKKFTKPFHKK